MNSHAKRNRQAGFSLLELMVTMGIMVLILGVVSKLMADALRSSTVVNETTEAQQSLRAVHEYLNRDLLVACDGLTGLLGGTVRMPLGFVKSNITTNPNDVKTLTQNGTTSQYAEVSLLTSDNAQSRSSAATGLLADTDRVTMMTLHADPSFPVSILGGNTTTFNKPNPDTLIANVPATTAALFRPGEVVLVTSGASGVATFATITGVKTGTGAQLTFAAGDAYGINVSPLPLLTNVVCGTGDPGFSTCNNVTVQRVLLITYFVDSDGLLRRRVLGKPRRGNITETAFTSNAMAGEIIAEHITELEARYGLVNPANKAAWDIVDQLTLAQQPNVRQVEVKVTAETPHAIKKTADGVEHATATSVVRTSVRTMEYRNAL